MPGQYTIKEIKKIIKARGSIGTDYPISTLITDSRRISNAAEGLFFALNGRRNVHEFVAAAYAEGVRNFVVKEGLEISMPGANILLVDDVLAALQTIAAH